MNETILIQQIREKFNILKAGMSEAVRRRWAAAEAKALGRGGITLVAKATELSISTIRQGLREIDQGVPLYMYRSRKPDGGRKKTTAKDKILLSDLESLVDPLTRGDPVSPLRWTCKSTRELAQELNNLGHHVSYHTVGELLRELGYSLQGDRKTQEGRNHPDRNKQFEHINNRTLVYHKKGQPVISVDRKKKERIGGELQECRPRVVSEGASPEVRVHDFVDPTKGKANPYGIYDIKANEGFVNVGTTHDTPVFAVASIRLWWFEIGRPRYPEASDLLIIADGGGSSSRSGLWKTELQHLANETGLRIAVSHLPPGTSKRNKIEHQMFCYITQDFNDYPVGLKASDEELKMLHIKLDKSHGE
jgi:transposase